MRTGVERMWRRGVVWFGKYTDIASLVLLFGFTQPIRLFLAFSHDERFEPNHETATHTSTCMHYNTLRATELDLMDPPADCGRQ